MTIVVRDTHPPNKTMKRIEVVEHDKSGGALEDIGWAAVTGGASLLFGGSSEEHRVVVRDNETGSYGVGEGSSRREAENNAIRNL